LVKNKWEDEADPWQNWECILFKKIASAETKWNGMALWNALFLAQPQKNNRWEGSGLVRCHHKCVMSVTGF
jgi:hypothetical protein